MYWMISAMLQLVVTMGARNPTIRKLCKVPDYLPGTILEGMVMSCSTCALLIAVNNSQNQRQKPQVIKTKIIDSIVRNPVDSQASSAQKAAGAEKKVPHEPTTGSNQEEVKVFTTKPKRTKKP